MRLLFALSFLLSAASCAPAPAVMLDHLRQVADETKAASDASKKACPDGVHAAPVCALLHLCLDQLRTAAHECNGAIVTGATAAGDEYSKAARRCTDAHTVAFVVCQAAGVRSEDSHGNR